MLSGTVDAIAIPLVELPAARRCVRWPLRLKTHVHLLAALDDRQSIQRPRWRSRNVQTGPIEGALMARADELRSLLVPRHEAAQIRTAAGKGRHTIFSPQDDDL